MCNLIAIHATIFGALPAWIDLDRRPVRRSFKCSGLAMPCTMHPPRYIISFNFFCRLLLMLLMRNESFLSTRMLAENICLQTMQS